MGSQLSKGDALLSVDLQAACACACAEHCGFSGGAHATSAAGAVAARESVPGLGRCCCAVGATTVATTAPHVVLRPPTTHPWCACRAAEVSARLLHFLMAPLSVYRGGAWLPFAATPRQAARDVATCQLTRRLSVGEPPQPLAVAPGGLYPPLAVSARDRGGTGGDQYVAGGRGRYAMLTAFNWRGRLTLCAYTPPRGDSGPGRAWEPQFRCVSVSEVPLFPLWCGVEWRGCVHRCWGHLHHL